MRTLDLGEPNARRLADERRRIGERIGAGNMLLIDEAQYLCQFNTRGADSWLALEWFRSMADECFINIARIGDLFLLGMAMALPQLWGRGSTNRPVIIRETAKSDVEAIAVSFGIQHATSLQMLRSVSKRGGLRQVSNVCRHSWVVSGALLRNLCLRHYSPFPRRHQAMRTISAVPRALKRLMRATRIWISAVWLSGCLAAMRSPKAFRQRILASIRLRT